MDVQVKTFVFHEGSTTMEIFAKDSVHTNVKKTKSNAHKLLLMDAPFLPCVIQNKVM